MGILRKLAELVVEFPEDKAAPAAGGQRDVLASIEEVRGQIEADTAQHKARLKHSVELPPGPEPDSQPPPKPKLPPLPSKLPPSAIMLPAVLGVREVYEKAGLGPKPDAFDIYTVEKMLQDPEIAELPLETRARSVRMALRSMGKELNDIISDAAKRDQALEIYEDFLSKALEQVSTQVVEANARLQSEMDEFVKAKSAQMESNRAALENARTGMAEFKRTKTAEEERLFSTVAPFVAPGQNPVQVGDNKEPGKDKGSQG